MTNDYFKRFGNALAPQAPAPAPTGRNAPQPEQDWMEYLFTDG